VFISLLYAGMLVAVAPPDTEPDLRVVEDVRGIHEFTFEMVPGGRPLRFEFVGDASNSPVEIRCYGPNEARPFQTLDLVRDAEATWGDIEVPYRGAQYLAAIDLDCDGSRELRVLAMWGATGRELYFYYVWKRERARFELGGRVDLDNPPECRGGPPR